MRLYGSIRMLPNCRQIGANLLDNARNFSEIMHGAPLLYNLILAEQAQRVMALPNIASASPNGRQLLTERSRIFVAWKRERFWELVRAGNPRISSSTHEFINTWWDLALGGDATGYAIIASARSLIRDRERRLKKNLARIDNPRAQELWSGDSGSPSWNLGGLSASGYLRIFSRGWRRRMLRPDERAHLLELLRPPSGCQLDFAVGTTFSLDLISALMLPLSFAFFDWEETDGKLVADPLALLEALRRYGDRFTIFCQSGQIRLLQNYQPLVTFLEPCIYDVLPPDPAGRFSPEGLGAAFSFPGWKGSLSCPVPEPQPDFRSVLGHGGRARW